MNKPKLEILTSEIENEICKIKKEKSERRKIRSFKISLKNTLTNSRTINEFIKEVKPKLNKIKNWREKVECELAIKDFLFNNKREWFFNNDIETMLSISNSLKYKLNEFNFKDLPNLDDRFAYYIDAIITDTEDNQFNEHERKLLKQLKDFLNVNPETEKILDKILIKLDEITIESENKLNKKITELRSDRIFLFTYWNLRKNQIREMNMKDIKKLFELDIDLVKQNYNVYPILFNYMDYIKNEILEAEFRGSKNIDVFHYISKLINGFTSVKAIEKYYYDTFTDLDKIRLLT